MCLRSVKDYISEIIRSSKLEIRIGASLPRNVSKNSLFNRFRVVRKNVESPHNPSHTLSFIAELFSLPSSIKGCIVEAGCYKGSSTAQFSICAAALNHPLVVFDSFEGLPDNDEGHYRSIMGHSIKSWFDKGKFYGPLADVQQNVVRYGEIKPCRFIKGWFEETMPRFKEPIAAAYIDVDLASSTKTCLKYLWPLIVSGGVLISQDGDFPLVIDVFNDERFWKQEVGCDKPRIQGLGHDKIIKIVKE